MGVTTPCADHRCQAWPLSPGLRSSSLEAIALLLDLMSFTKRFNYYDPEVGSWLSSLSTKLFTQVHSRCQIQVMPHDPYRLVNFHHFSIATIQSRGLPWLVQASLETPRGEPQRHCTAHHEKSCFERIYPKMIKMVLCKVCIFLNNYSL